MSAENLTLENNTPKTEQESGFLKSIQQKVIALSGTILIGGGFLAMSNLPVNAQSDQKLQNTPFYGENPVLLASEYNSNDSQTKLNLPKPIGTYNNLPIYNDEEYLTGGLVVPQSEEVKKYGSKVDATKFIKGTTRLMDDFSKYFNKGPVMVPVTIANAGTEKQTALGQKYGSSEVVKIKMQFKAIQTGWIKREGEDSGDEVANVDPKLKNLIPVFKVGITIYYPKDTNRKFYVQGQNDTGSVGFIPTPGKEFFIEGYGGPFSFSSIGTGVLPKK